VAAAALLAMVSFVDDRRGLPVALRFGLQALCAAACCASAVAAGALPAPWLLVVVPAWVWITNLYNFMDGSDGLAGGMALIGFGSCALAAAPAPVATAAAAIAGAATGFLAFNFPPARVFLGDIGSIPLGFLAGAAALGGTLSGAWPWWFVPLAFSPFIADASLTLLARALRGERVWQAHREHVYQRMVASGYGHRGTALRWYLLMAAAGGSALALRAATPAVVAAGLGAWVAFYVVAFVVARRRWAPAGARRGGSGTDGQAVSHADTQSVTQADTHGSTGGSGC